MISVKSHKIKISKSIKTLINNVALMAFKVLCISKPVSLSVMLSDDVFIRSLNFKYRGIDKVTDVLSFTFGEEFPDEESNYLGDIAISMPTCTKQALDAGHSVENELALLTTHGILHLLGYDHDEPEAKNRMWNLQNLILEKMGIHISHFSGDENE